jgi:hypothetical protein
MAAKSLDLNKALIFFGYFFASRQKSDNAKIKFKSLITWDKNTCSYTLFYGCLRFYHGFVARCKFHWRGD